MSTSLEHDRSHSTCHFNNVCRRDWLLFGWLEVKASFPSCEPLTVPFSVGSLAPLTTASRVTSSLTRTPLFSHCKQAANALLSNMSYIYCGIFFILYVYFDMRRVRYALIAAQLALRIARVREDFGFFFAVVCALNSID